MNDHGGVYPQCTVSIGRNVGAVPLHYRRWHSYKSEVMDLFLLLPGTTVVGTTSGRSVWRQDDSEWVSEQSFTIHVLDVPVSAGTAIRRSLASLAGKYGQDSIALTVSDPQFIQAR